jgi:hypothetical protein
MADRIGPLWVVRDGERKRGDYRREEWIAHGVTSEKIDQLARQHARGRFAVCAIHGVDESDEPLRAAFRALDYRLGSTEAVMVHELKRIPRFERPLEIARVTTAALADRLNKRARARQILPDHLAKGSPVRQYVALFDDQPVGWVRSIDVGRQAGARTCTWTQNFVGAGLPGR